MKRLVLHHRYSEGIAWDTSGYNNHGRVGDCDRGSGATQGALGFHHPDSRIDVPPSDTLRHLGAFRCCVRFYLEGDPSARYNLVESELSFAFFVEGGHRLAATILDATGHWTGAFSDPGTVPTNGWHRADCGHDGISTSWVALDGNVIATNTGSPGPVRPVGAQGLTVGHWPEPADQYAFKGFISEVWLWQTRPDPVSHGCCCTDPDAFARLSAAGRARGWTYDSVQDTLDQVRALTAGVAQKLPISAQQTLGQLGMRLAFNVRAGDWNSAGHTIDDLAALVGAHLTKAEQHDAARAIGQVFEQQGYNEQLVDMANQTLLCTPPTRPPRKGGGKSPGWPKPGTPPGDGPLPSTPEGQKPQEA